jgi:hypothetical protein
VPALMAVSPARGRRAGARLRSNYLDLYICPENLILPQIPFPYANSGVSIALTFVEKLGPCCLPITIARRPDFFPGLGLGQGSGTHEVL